MLTFEDPLYNKQQILSSLRSRMVKGFHKADHRIIYDGIEFWEMAYAESVNCDKNKYLITCSERLGIPLILIYLGRLIFVGLCQKNKNELTEKQKNFPLYFLEAIKENADLTHVWDVFVKRTLKKLIELCGRDTKNKKEFYTRYIGDLLSNNIKVDFDCVNANIVDAGLSSFQDYMLANILLSTSIKLIEFSDDVNEQIMIHRAAEFVNHVGNFLEFFAWKENLSLTKHYVLPIGTDRNAKWNFFADAAEDLLEIL